MRPRQTDGSGGRRAFSADQAPERPADPAIRRANLRRVAILFKPYRRRLAAVLALIFQSALLGIVAPFLVRDIFDEALPQDDDRLLTLLVLGLIAIAVATGVLGVAQTWLSNVVGQRVMHDLRAAVYRHLQRLSLAFFTRTRTGEVQSRIANDIGGVERVVTSTATSIVSNVTTVMATVVAMFLLDWRLAVFSLALVPVFVLLMRQVMAGRWVMASIQMSFSIMPALVYWFAGQSFVGGVTLGTVVAFTTLQTRLFFPVGQLLSVQIDVQTSLALFDRVFEYLDLPVEIVERADAVDLPPCRGDLAFEGVWFRYEEKGTDGSDGGWTLSDVSFEVPAGTTTAVVGETGSGKTTVGYLVARLYDVERGRVTIDGIDVRGATLSSLARTVGVVSQETYLFHASIKDNLRFAKPEASDEEIEAAARAARIHDLIASLPEGYDTMVGERGYRFSGGEKQRIAIARKISRNPPVLVLDEATSALDTQTERAVQEALERLSEGRTTIAIAHRLSTVRDADQIVVLDRGRVVEIGTYGELFARGGRFAELAAPDDGGAGG